MPVMICCARCRAPLTTVFQFPALGTVIPGDGDPVRQGTWALTRETHSVSHSGGKRSPDWVEVVVAEAVPRIVIHPDDRLPDAVANIPGHSAGCCGLDGLDGPNQACVRCQAVVGTARTDCWTEDAIWFLPQAVVPI